jgi:hypothetical protein
MKNYCHIILLLIPYYVLSQDKNLQIIDSCKTISDNKVLIFNKENLDFSLKFNDETSYINIDFRNNDDDEIQLKRVRLSELNTINLKDKNYFLTYNFIYNVRYKEYSIYSISLKCDEKIPDKLKYYENIMKNLKNGKLISPITAIEIAKKNGLNTIFSCVLDEDPRWEGLNFYEENEKKWKVTWTIKTESNSDGGTDVIKLNARNGKVLYKYTEFPID